MQDPTLNRTDNGSLYREPFYFDIFDLRYMLNSISTLTLTFVIEKKILPNNKFTFCADQCKTHCIGKRKQPFDEN